MLRYFRRFQHFVPPPEAVYLAAEINAGNLAVICNEALGDAATGSASQLIVPC